LGNFLGKDWVWGEGLDNWYGMMFTGSKHVKNIQMG